MADLVTLDKTKAFLRITGTAEDDRLGDYIRWASERIRREISTVTPETVTETVAAQGWQFTLQRTPVRSIASITALSDGAPAIDVADLTVRNTLGGVVEALRGACPMGLYSVVYEAGWDDVTPGVDGACLVLIRHWWNQAQAHASSTYDTGGFVPDFRGLPNTVLNMLGVVPKVPGVA